MHVLVTGGAGYIGSVIVRILLNAGYKVRILEKFMFGMDSVKEIINNPNLEIVIGDVRDSNDLKSAIQGADAVIHLAAIVGDPACAARETEVVIGTNTIATTNLARLCKEQKIKRFIFASTCSVYGFNDKILTETDATNPLSTYAETKLFAEKGILSLVDDDFSPCILRLGTAHGSSPRMRFDLVINYLTQKAFNEKKIMIFGGNQSRPFVHVEDIAQAFKRVLESPLEDIKGQIFNVGSSEENYLLRDVGGLIAGLTGAEVDYLEEAKDNRSYGVSFEKIKKIGFKRTRTLKDSVTELITTLKDKPINTKDPKYYNYHPQ